MSGLEKIIKKEIKELLTLKTIIPVIILAVLYAFLGQYMGGITEQAGENPTVGIIDKDNSPISKQVVDVFEKMSNIVYFSTENNDFAEVLRQIEKEGAISLVVISSDFGEDIKNGQPGNVDIQWLVEGVGIGESIPSGAVNGIIQIASERISQSLIEKVGTLNPVTTIHPIKKSQTTLLREKNFEGASPGQLGGAFASQSTLIPIIIMMIIMMSGGQVIQSMGMEKGNKTLETLLTLPVKRSHIAIGKIIGSAIVGLLMAGIFMVGFSFYMQSFRPQAVDIAGAGLTLGLIDYVLLGLSLFLAIVAGLSICMLMGAFATDYKSAQARMFPLVILVLIPFFLSMFKSFYTLPFTLKILLFAIPFSHPMMASGLLMFDDHLLVFAGIAYLVVFIICIMAIITYVFKRDTLITGRFEIKWIDKFRSYHRR